MTDESYQKIMSEIESMTAKDIEKLSKEVTEEMKLYTPNSWHTGTPTEEGWYLLAFKEKGKRIYDANRLWGTMWEYCLIGDIIAWQKITPYEEKENGR